MTRKFIVEITWEESREVEIEADDLEQAGARADEQCGIGEEVAEIREIKGKQP